MMHKTYLPFNKDQLLEHFAPVKGKNGSCIKNMKHAGYYEKSIQRYKQSCLNGKKTLHLFRDYARNKCSAPDGALTLEKSDVLSGPPGSPI